MPDKIYGPNYRWRRGLVDGAYAALYPPRGGAAPPPPPLGTPTFDQDTLRMDATTDTFDEGAA